MDIHWSYLHILFSIRKIFHCLRGLRLMDPETGCVSTGLKSTLKIGTQTLKLISIFSQLEITSARKFPPETNGVVASGPPTRLGSPFWCGLGSRDPQSRTFEFPERDVPITSSISAGVTISDTPPAYKHVTNLLIDKVR